MRKRKEKRKEKKRKEKKGIIENNNNNTHCLGHRLLPNIVRHRSTYQLERAYYLTALSENNDTVRIFFDALCKVRRTNTTAVKPIAMLTTTLSPHFPSPKGLSWTWQDVGEAFRDS